MVIELPTTTCCEYEQLYSVPIAFVDDVRTRTNAVTVAHTGLNTESLALFF